MKKDIDKKDEWHLGYNQGYKDATEKFLEVQRYS